MRLIYKANGREYWIKFDGSARVYEMFASEDGDDYLGAFDSATEAKEYAKRHAVEG